MPRSHEASMSRGGQALAVLVDFRGRFSCCCDADVEVSYRFGSCRRKPIFLIRESKVVGFTPSNSAAP